MLLLVICKSNFSTILNASKYWNLIYNVMFDFKYKLNTFLEFFENSNCDIKHILAFFFKFMNVQLTSLDHRNYYSFNYTKLQHFFLAAKWSQNKQNDKHVFNHVLSILSLLLHCEKSDRIKENFRVTTVKMLQKQSVN